MSKLPLDKGRVRQKLQTRTEILAAARQLMNKDADFTLEEVAEKAGISRATIYRYFSDLNLLCAEAALDIYHKSQEQLMSDVKDKSFSDRIFYVQQYYNQLAQQHETAFRRYLSVVLQESVKPGRKKLRGARRVKTLTSVLKPYKKQLDPATYDNLIALSSILMGIDPLVAAKDVCGLQNAEADRVLRWGLEMVLRALDREQLL